MDHDPKLETWLRDTQAPRIVEGSHRARLKTQLLQHAHKEKTIMVRELFKNHKIAWALGTLLVFSVVATAWAGYSYFIVDQSPVILIDTEKVIDHPDGSQTIEKETVGVATGTGIMSNNPKFTAEKAREIQQLIAQKKYQFLGKIEKNGMTIYEYKFTLSDGEEVKLGGNVPFENFSSPTFSQADAQKQYQEIQQLIAQKKYRFVNEQEVNGMKVYTYEFTLSDGRKIGWGSPTPLD